MRARRALGLIALASLAGCYSIRYHTRAAKAPAPASERWHHTNLFGLVDSSGPVQVSEICPGGVAVVENELSVGNRFANLFSLWWIWQPTTVRVTCSTGAAAAPRKALRVVVLKLVAKGGLEAATADVLTDALVGELRKHAGLAVISPGEIATLIGFEKEKQLMGCTDAGCMTEIAGAIGADRLVTGSLGRLGASTVVTLTSLDAKKAVPVASIYETFKGGDGEELLRALPSLVSRLAAAR